MKEPLIKEFPKEGEVPVNWEQFERKIRELRECHTSRRIASPLLFRGQRDAGWRLQTTLERRSKKNMLFREYYAVISRIKPQIEAFTKGLWGIPDFVSVMRLLEDYDTFSLDLDNGKFPAQEYMVYLRHHGFPSPLLDWTRSPYIAVYFAFSSEHKPPQGQVSVLLVSGWARKLENDLKQRAGDSETWSTSPRPRAPETLPTPEAFSTTSRLHSVLV